MKRAYLMTQVLFFSLIFACSDGSPVVAGRRVGHIEELTVRSASMADNSLNEPAQRSVNVLLPPGYDEGAERYPVVYYLHGYGGDSSQIQVFAEAAYAAMETGRAKPFLIVAVDGANSLGGGFYVNSPRTGRWEDHLTGELTAAIDARYRTIPTPGGRGLMGFSMGGFGALRLALAHPDKFSAAWALCPGVFMPGKGLPEAMESWWGYPRMKKAYAAAFSEANAAPSFDGSAGDKRTVAEWEAGFGNWDDRLTGYADRNDRLDGIRIVSGKHDPYSWITEGSRYLAKEMEKRGLPVEAVELPIGHEITAQLVTEDALPFFERHLKR